MRISLSLVVVVLGCATPDSTVTPDSTEGETSAAISAGTPITSALVGKCLDDNADSTVNGAKIQLWDCNGSAAQAWTYSNGTLVGPGGKCLDIEGDNQVAGTLVDLYQCNGTNAQKWTLSGTTIKSTAGLCLDAKGGVNADGTPIEVWTCNGGVNQTWHFTAPTPTDPCHAFTLPASATLFASTKKVFAHYFYPFPLSIGNVTATTDYYNTQYLAPAGENNKWLAYGGYLRSRPLPVTPGASTTYQLDNAKKEVELAIAAGITGFTIDILNANQVAAGSQMQNLLSAATAVDSRFKIVVMPDVSALGANAAEIEAVIEAAAKSPAAYRLADGRLVVSAFDASLAPVSFWTTVLADLKTAGVDVAFVPTFLGWGGQAAAYAPIVYGFADWGTATPASGIGEQSSPALAHSYNRIFMAPVDPQQYRPKDFLFWEAGNSAAFRNAWTSAIAGNSDWVQLVTWSDFSESSAVEPYTDATLSSSIGTGFYDLNAYYASWFATGTAPTITHDVLYYFYRRERTDAPAPAQTTPTTVAAGGGTAANEIEMLAFLTAPGTLEITINGVTTTKTAPAGITSFTVPLAAGTPHFVLQRNGISVISYNGGVAIANGGLANGTLDLTYWSGSASAAGVCALTVP